MLPKLFSDNWLVYFIGYNGFFAVDTFFWLSAFLMVFIFCPMYEAKRCRIGVVGWVMVYVHRFMRIVPVYAAFMAFYNLVLPALSEGP
mmetsp:Transcript_14237/g.2322  ORF Transcript_14237/g.2322 Transcript_14237/m.2322 type:complete len:88 (+) Transcript_14237:678-941(+)